MNSQVRLEQAGDGLIVRIPIEMIEKGNLKADTLITLALESDEFRIRARRIPQYSLDELLEGMTPEHFHAEIDTGPPVGEEIW